MLYIDLEHGQHAQARLSFRFINLKIGALVFDCTVLLVNTGTSHEHVYAFNFQLLILPSVTFYYVLL